MQGCGVIFDMDGVLIDTYKSHYESWRRMAGRFGLAMTEKQFGETFGRTSREIIRLLWPDRGFSDRDVEEMDREKERIFREIIDASFPLMPGADTLLRSLHVEGFRIAVGSSGPAENVALTVRHLREIITFDAVVHGGDVTRGKPDPEVFLAAARRIGVDPARCVVVEDAVPGLRAAHAAGMRAIGMVSTGHTREELAMADHLVDALAEINPRVIRDLLESC